MAKWHQCLHGNKSFIKIEHLNLSTYWKSKFGWQRKTHVHGQQKNVGHISIMANWHQFLLDNKFFIKTNHLILKYLLMQGTLKEEQEKWKCHSSLVDWDELPTFRSISVNQLTWVQELLIDYIENRPTVQLKGHYRWQEEPNLGYQE